MTDPDRPPAVTPRDRGRRRSIYASDALHSDAQPHTPTEQRASRSMIDWAAASHALMPVTLRDRAISVRVETDRSTYPPGHPVGIRVTLRNTLPVPVRLRTESPVGWQWAVDGVVEASTVDHGGPADAGALSFARRERKTFVRRWAQSIQRSPTNWEPVPPGSYEIAAWVNVDAPADRRLRDETTITIGDQ